jgi:predicted unusual protein kinase regulating ubiquinone biosynthesis (AarF/ABC1/UbiB family)
MPNTDPPPNVDDEAAGGDGITQGRLRRASSLAGLTARTAGESIAVGLRAKLTGVEDPGFHARAAERYAELLGRSKGVLMKAGQMLSFLAIVPLPSAEMRSIYQTALERLRSDAPPMPPELARATLERELGKPAEDAFAEIDWRPLAAASIGQVHAGRLHDGRAVAVKIQYPGAADAIRSDLKNVELLATFLRLACGAIFPLSLDLRAASREMSLRITEELDYRRELASQSEFAEHYRGHPFIHVPEVFGELCTERVLTQELASGRSWSEALVSPQALRDEWGEAIYRFTYGSFARYGLIHADPHPGNYLFHDDGSVSVLDFGCVKRFSHAKVKACLEALRAACRNNDALATWQAGVDAGLWGASDPITPEEVLLVWREMYGYLVEEQPRTLTFEHLARCAVYCSPEGPAANLVRNITGSTDYTVMPRIEMGMLSLLAGLRASGDWTAVMGEWFDREAAPRTAMGQRHRAFLEERAARTGAR